jgi:hypothetical protein
VTTTDAGDAPDIRRPGRYGPLPPSFHCKLVGATFRPCYPDSILELADAAEFAARAGQSDDVRSHLNRKFRTLVDVALVAGAIPVELRREPDNEADRLAVAVWVPRLECGAIGFLPATTHGNLAHRVAVEMDRGVDWAGWVAHVNINRLHPERPGVDLLIERKAGT